MFLVHIDKNLYLYLRFSRYLITFDGLYASLQMVNLQMADAGTYKVVFSNEAGEDESAGKVNVKEVRQPFVISK